MAECNISLMTKTTESGEIDPLDIVAVGLYFENADRFVQAIACFKLACEEGLLECYLYDGY